MTVYYRGPAVHITDDLFEVHTPEPQVFHIRELTSVQVVPGSLGTPVARLFAVAAIPMAVALPLVEAPAGLLVVALTTVGASVAVVWLRNPGRPYELHAVHRGVRVQLFGCRDARTFGQVRRALARAIERSAVG
jgi:hypothetical protein